MGSCKAPSITMGAFGASGFHFLVVSSVGSYMHKSRAYSPKMVNRHLWSKQEKPIGGQLETQAGS